MNIRNKRRGLGAAVLVGASLLLVPALRTSAGVLPDPARVPCEAYGADADCPLRGSRELPLPCAAPDLTIAEVDVLRARLVADLVAHATYF